MTEAKATNKMVRMLVEVKVPGGISRWEWRDVPGTEIELKGVELKNGDTLEISHTE